jgi:hypothetical protein
MVVDSRRVGVAVRVCVVAVALALAGDLVLAPWYSLSLGIYVFSSPATGDPGSVWGVLALLAACFVGGEAALELRGGRAESLAPFSPPRVWVAGGGVAFLLVKVAAHSADLAPGAWRGLGLAGALLALTASSAALRD